MTITINRSGLVGPRSHRRRRRAGWVLAIAAVGLLAGTASTAGAVGGSFAATGSMQVGRYDETQNLVTLCDGRQMITGGNVPGAWTDSVEVYDPATGQWTTAAPMTYGRSSHTATVLADCRVLVAGGASGDLASSEIYDPQTGAWTPTGSLHTGRHGHTAFRLPDGTVLVAGGGVPGSGDTIATGSAEIYDPATGTWTVTGSLQTARMNHSAAQLLDGRVVVAGGMPHGGGYGGPGFDSAEVYDPATGLWTYTSPLVTARRGFQSMTTLHDGRVLLAGGHTSWTGTSTDAVELLDPATMTWSPGPVMPGGRYFHSATVMLDGTVLVAGGSSDGGTYLADAAIFDPVAATWAATGSSLVHARGVHEATLLPTGRVLLVGGWNGAIQMETAELYQPPSSVAGFFPPVDMRTPANPTVVNTVKSGSTVPLKFEVFVGSSEITSPAAVAGITVTQVTCSPGTEAPIEEIVPASAGGSTLRYDAESGHFVYNWKTPPRSAGTCYRVTMATTDDVTITAWFKLK